MKIPLAGSLKRALTAIAGSRIVPFRRRTAFLRRMGVTVGPDTALGFGVEFCNPTSVRVGPGCFINSQVYFDAGPVRLGSNVTIGPRAMIITGHHDLGPSSRRAAGGGHREVVIEDGCWIGAGAIVLPGVTIGPGCVIGAGAIVTSDCTPDGVYVGVPARRVRDLDPHPAHEIGRRR